MAGGTSGTWLDALVALIDGRWQPDFSATIRGAAPETLAEIEAALGCPLLPEHRAFLARLGEDHGGLDAYGGDLVDLRAPALLDFLAADHGFDPAAFMIAGVSGTLTIPLLMFDRRGRPAGELTPLVRVGFGDGERLAITPEFTSLPAMLFMFAFLKKCLPRYAWEQRLESPGTRRPHFPNTPPGRWLPYFARIVAAAGFAVVPDTGPWSVCAEREGAAVMMYECPGYAPDVRVAASERIELAKLVELLVDNLELRAKPGGLRTPD